MLIRYYHTITLLYNSMLYLLLLKLGGVFFNKTTFPSHGQNRVLIKMIKECSTQCCTDHLPQRRKAKVICAEGITLEENCIIQEKVLYIPTLLGNWSLLRCR